MDTVILEHTGTQEGRALEESSLASKPFYDLIVFSFSYTSLDVFVKKIN